MSSQARSRGGMEAEDEDVTFSSEPEVICGLGVVIASTFLSVTFGGLGYILCDGVDRCFPSLLGEVRALDMIRIPRRPSAVRGRSQIFGGSIGMHAMLSSSQDGESPVRVVTACCV